MLRDSQTVALFLFWRRYSFCCPDLFTAKGFFTSAGEVFYD